MPYYQNEEHDPILAEQRRKRMEEFREESRKLFDKFSDSLYGDYLVREDTGYYIGHIHACSLYLKNVGVFAGPHVGKQIGIVNAQKKCEEYLASQGKKMDEEEEVCDTCLYMREVLFDDDGNILFVY